MSGQKGQGYSVYAISKWLPVYISKAIDESFHCSVVILGISFFCNQSCECIVISLYGQISCISLNTKEIGHLHKWVRAHLLHFDSTGISFHPHASIQTASSGMSVDKQLSVVKSNDQHEALRLWTYQQHLNHNMCPLSNMSGPRKSHDEQGSLAYCSPWGHRESDMTE